MRPIELALIVLNAAILGMLLIPRLRRQSTALMVALAATVPLILVHLLVEGYRWQMIPVYLLTLINAVILYGRRREARRWLGALIALSGVLLVIGAAALILLPVPRLPKPSGPYAIGTFTVTWVDESRRGVYTPDPDDPRRLNVQIWYPADSAQGDALPWVADGVVFGRAMTGWVGLPAILLDQVGLAETHTYAGLPVSSSQPTYPVILYSHGWGGTRNINQDQIEALASQGYIVVSADHTYGALATMFEDGPVYHNPDALPNDLPDEEEDIAGNKLIGTYAADLRFMLDQLEALNSGDDTPVGGRMDLERIGLFGHSTGGGAVMLACAEDPRCDAVLGQDTWITPLGEDFAAAGLDQPAMLINSETWGLERTRPRLETFYDALRGEKYWAIIAGSSHYDFVMVPLFSPLATPLGMKGPIRGERMVEINHAYLVAFFDRHLKGEAAPLLEGSGSPFPEVTYRMGR